jgi:predicted nucleic-acid-binding Zn-ribbon protein
MRCETCHHDRFYSREGKITTAMTFFDLDWANASATCIVCERCGYVHWFLPT